MVKKSGKIITLPVTKGTGKNPHISDYVNMMPVNMLTVPPKLITDSGYMRSFPGLVKSADVDGISRGVLKNAADGKIYRGCGGKIYREGVPVADIPGEDKISRISMAGSVSTVAFSAENKMIILRGDDSTVALENWPPSQYYAGSSEILDSGTTQAGFNGTLQLTESMTDKGRLKLTITPGTVDGAAGEPLTLDTVQAPFSQEKPAEGTPYITDAIISGFIISGTTLTVSYTFNANGATGDENSTLSWTQTVEPTNIENAQFELGEVGDITHANARYAWIKKGTNTFGVTDTSDETKPDRYRPFTTAESFPDPAVGISTLNSNIVVFGTVSTEFFSLTGSADTTQPIYRTQSAMMIPVGIAGPHCKALAGSQFAVISNPAGGKVSVYLLGSGRATEIASPEVMQALASVTPQELEAGVVEYLSMGIHNLIFVRVGSYSFCYDLTSKNWCQLTAGTGAAPHPAVDFAHDGHSVTAGDAGHPITGKTDESIASQYGALQRHILYSPMMSAENSRLFDLELETVTGTAQGPEHLAVSASTDGFSFPYEVLADSDGAQRYGVIPCLRRVGYVQRNISFRFRALTSTPFTVSNCRVRIV